MSKYKSFASQGSFSANQLKAPDESSKILEAAERRIRGMDTAQAFLQKNNEIYLRAQEYVQGVEQKNREQNFKLETENRRNYQQAVQRNNQIAIENEKAKTSQTEQLYKDLSTFSQTAFNLYGTFEEQRKKTRQAFAVQEVMKSGLDYDQIRELTSIDQSLTDSAFRQTEFIKNLIDSGATEDQINVLGNMWRKNSPNLYLNTQAAYQRSYGSYVSGADQAIAELGPDATLEQKRARLATYSSEFVVNKLPGARAEMLESSGLLRNMQSYNNQLISGYARIEASKREAEVKLRFKDDLQTVYNKDGLEGVIRQFQKDPAKWKRDSLGEFIATGLKGSGPGSISQTDALAVLEYPITVGGKTVPLGQQFPDLNATITEGARAARRVEVNNYNFAIDKREREANAQLAKEFDAFAVEDDGRIEEEELEVLRERALALGVPDSPVLEFAQNNSVNAFTDRAIEVELMKKANNLTLTLDDVNSIKMGANLRNKLVDIATKQEQMRSSPIYKSHLTSIKAAVSQHPNVAKTASITGAANYSVVLMQDKFVKQYKENLKRLESPEEALSLTLQQIKTLQETPGAITTEGRYSEIEQEIKNNAQEAGQSLNNYNQLLGEMLKPEFRNDPKYAFNAVGHANFHEAYNAMYAGKEAPPMIKSGAAMMGVDPLTFINYLASGIDVDPIEPKDTLLRDIKASAPPIIRRLYDTYRTNERTTRANTTVIGRLNQSPKRGAFSNEPFDMSMLTQKDYDDLAFAISSEAAINTDDEFGVAANIITRLMTGRYGNSISEIIHAPKQYEGVYTGRSKPSPEIAARLQSPEGQKKILEFIKILNGRTEFKGQSQLKNRVPSEDPMFAVSGNFYHYAGQ